MSVACLETLGHPYCQKMRSPNSTVVAIFPSSYVEVTALHAMPGCRLSPRFDTFESQRAISLIAYKTVDPQLQLSKRFSTRSTTQYCQFPSSAELSLLWGFKRLAFALPYCTLAGSGQVQEFRPGNLVKTDIDRLP
jgi:hypothetical protein